MNSDRASPETESSRNGARTLRLAAGWSLLVAGGALLVLPGPGIPLVLGGLALLARDQPWAGRLLARARERWERISHRGLPKGPSGE